MLLEKLSSPIFNSHHDQKNLLTANHPLCPHFLKNILMYNSLFQMTSFGVKEIWRGGLSLFQTRQIYHRKIDVSIRTFFRKYADNGSLPVKRYCN